MSICMRKRKPHQLLCGLRSEPRKRQLLTGSDWLMTMDCDGSLASLIALACSSCARPQRIRPSQLRQVHCMRYCARTDNSEAFARSADCFGADGEKGAVVANLVKSQLSAKLLGYRLGLVPARTLGRPSSELFVGNYRHKTLLFTFDNCQ